MYLNSMFHFLHLFYNNHINVTNELVLFILFCFLSYVCKHLECLHIFTYLMISYSMVVTTNIVFGDTYYYKCLTYCVFHSNNITGMCTA